MKKNTVKLFILAFAFGGSLTAYSQTKEQAAKILQHYDLEKGKELVQELTRQNQESYQKALELAEVKGWPLKIQKDGYTAMLTGVTADNTPLYIQPYNDASVYTARVNQIHSGGSLGYNLNGQNMLLGVWEPGRVRITHFDLVGAVTVQDGATFNGDDDNNSHATHVSGTLIGRGVINASARGFAYEAMLYAHDSFNDNAEALAAAQDPVNPILVSNHSYGPFTEGFTWQKGAYVAESYNWDLVCNQAPYYQPVFAAGNDRVGESRDWLAYAATSKNVLVVAAAQAINTQNPTPSQIQMSSFSSYGPTDDRRIKPDIAADGVNLLSCDSSSNTAYGTKSGTSMASPSAAGTLILLQQHYNDLYTNFMRAATLRGLAIHTATEAGFYDGPDHRFGWGLINGAAAVELITGAHSQLNAYIEEHSLSQSTTFTKNVKAIGGGQKLKVSICWTDPVKASSINNGTNNSTTPVLTNDLDVRVTKDGETYYPWKLNNIVDSAPVKADNTVDNIEVIEIDNPQAGATYTVTVSHKSILQNFNDQPYSLIISGVTDINGLSDKKEMKLGIYPNPAKDVINITLNNSLIADECTVTLYDLQGREVKTISAVKGAIDVSDVSTGVYMLMINVADGSYTESRKVIIE